MVYLFHLFHFGDYVSSFSLSAGTIMSRWFGVCYSRCVRLFFTVSFMMYSFEPIVTSFGLFFGRVALLFSAVAFLPGRGSHSWLGRVRSSSPALIGFDAIIGDGLVLFCSTVTGLQDKQHMEQKKKA